jgi:Exopolysaccharide biosynthesis protein YbjH
LVDDVFAKPEQAEVKACFKRRLAWGFLCLTGATAWAEDAYSFAITSSYSGASGLLVIPHARSLGDGVVELRLDTFRDRRFIPRYTFGYDTGFALGIVPGLEISGRIAEYKVDRGNIGLRDLSANAKWQLPKVFDAQPDIALGVTDYGGAASNFVSSYGVASKAFGPLDLTLGYGRGPDQFKGWFGGVQLTTPVEGLSALAEHDSRDKYLGLRYVSPAWEAMGHARLIGTLSRSLGARDAKSQSADRTEFGLSLQIPLGRKARGSGAASRSETGSTVFAAATKDSVIHWQSADGALKPMLLPAHSSTPSDTSVSTSANAGTEASSDDHVSPEVRMSQARQALIAAGLDHVRLGTTSTKASSGKLDWVAQMEPALYARNDADAVGVALGVMAHASAGEPVNDLVLVLERAGQGIYQVRVKRDAWQKFLDTGDSSGVVESLQAEPGPGVAEHTVRWLNAPVERQDKLRVSVGLRYAAYYATEVGIYDYSLAPAVTAHVPLWRGAELSATGVLQPLQSRNFQPGYVFSGTGIRSGMSQAALNQSWWLGSHVLNVSSMGRYFYDQWGIQHESVAFLPWNEDSLRFRFTKTRRASDVAASSAPAERESAQVTYRWQLPSLDAYTELHWNRYISGDAGPSVDFRRFFGDFSFGLTLRSSERDKFAGLTVELPLMPGHGWRSGAGFSVSSERVAQTGVLSRVGNTHNSVAADAAVLTPYDYNVTNLMLNRNRWQRAYFLQELPRLKAAYEAEVSKLQQSSSAPVPIDVSNPKGNP